MHEEDDGSTTARATSTNTNINVTNDIREQNHQNETRPSTFAAPNRHHSTSSTDTKFHKHAERSEEDVIPQINFRRTSDMIGQKHLQRRVMGMPNMAMGIMGTDMDMGMGIGRNMDLDVDVDMVNMERRPANPGAAPGLGTSDHSATATAHQSTAHEDPILGDLGNQRELGSEPLSKTFHEPTTNTLAVTTDQNTDVSSSSTPTAVANCKPVVPLTLRPARVHKAPRQSRSASSKQVMSEYTTRLAYLEALNMKHLKGPSSTQQHQT